MLQLCTFEVLPLQTTFRYNVRKYNVSAHSIQPRNVSTLLILIILNIGIFREVYCKYTALTELANVVKLLYSLLLCAFRRGAHSFPCVTRRQGAPRALPTTA